jgi:hypothetical protein
MRKALSVSAFLLTAALVASLAGCSSGNDDPSVDPNLYKSLLYMTDTYSGKVYTYDPATRAASGASLATVGQNATGELAFYKGVGYACVGSGTNAGVYYFAPSATNPAFTKIPGTICAAYCAFASGTKAYVSVYDYSTNADGIYTFDPSAPADGISYAPISGTGGDGFQELVIASDGSLYAANNADGAVLRINTATDAITATIAASSGGTTGLAAGTYKGNAGVFVANTGGYDAEYNALPGSIDFIPIGAANGSSATAVASALTAGGGPIYPARLVQLPGGDLVATGYGHTYLIDLSGDTPVVSELKASGTSFGSLDIAYKDGLIYVPVPDYGGDTDRLYVFDAEGSQAAYSPVAGVMGAGDAIANIAFYED